MIRRGRTIVPNSDTGTRTVELVEPESAVVDEGGSAGACPGFAVPQLSWYGKVDPRLGVNLSDVFQFCGAIDQMVYVTTFRISEGTWEL